MSTALVTTDTKTLESFAARDKEKIQALAEVLEVESRTSGGISAFDLTRIKIPAGGAVHWSIPTADGEEVASEFSAIILDSRETRSYWEGEFSGGGQPPDCSSTDAVRGSGAFGVNSDDNPSGLCARCPQSQWGSGPKGIGQSCRIVRQVFLLRSEELLPTLLFLPVSSQKPFRQYTLKLASAGVQHYAVLTSFKLVKATSRGNIAYSQVAPSLVSAIPKEELGWIKEYRDALLPALRHAADSFINEDTGEIFEHDAA